MSQIEVRDLTVRYGRRSVLHNVSFKALAGEVTVIAGPNGSGKSTLVKAISSEIAYGGIVSINGNDTGALKASHLASLRAVLPQETTVAFPYTVAEVVKLGINAGATGRASAAGLVDAALKKVGLDGFAHRLIPELSGGERQRVQIARVLCQIWEPVGEAGPRWLLLDEPVASLDIRHQISLMDLARDYAARGGGVVAVMHDLNLSAIYAERLVLMKDGQIAAEGMPSAILTTSVLKRVFECPLHPNITPVSGTFILPQSISEAG